MKKIIFLLFLGIGCGQVHAVNLHLQDLSGGMYPYLSPNKIPDNGAAYIQNFFTDIQPMAVERNGYALQDSNVGTSTKPVNGLWRFVDNSGNEWIIEYASRTYYKHTSGNSPVSFGFPTGTSNIPRAATNLGKIMFVDGVDTAWTFDGTTSTTVPTAPIGTLILPWRTRFVIAGIPGSQSTLRFSADGDATSWTLGPNPTDPFSVQIGGANDGYAIKCMGNYLDSLIAQRKYDTWAISGFDQSDVQNRNISSEIGCIEQGTAREFDGSYMFLSWRGFEEMRGFNISLVSEPIRNITDVLIKNTANQRSNIQTTQTDFNAGTYPSSLSTTIQSGSVVASTKAASSFVDTVSTDFAAGTFSNTVGGTDNISLSQTAPTSTAVVVNFTAGTNPQLLRNYSAGSTCFVTHYQYFSSSFNYYLSSVTVRVSRDASYGGNIVVTINGQSATISNPLIQLVATDVVAVFPSDILMVAGTTYTIRVYADSFQSTSGSGAYWYYDTSGSPYTLNSTSESGPTACPGFCACGSTLYGSAETSGRRYRFSTYGWQFAYQTAGNFISRSFDVGVTTQTWLWKWGTVNCGLSQPPTSTTLVQTQTSSSTNGPWEGLQNVDCGGTPISTVQEFIRYKISFTVVDQSTSPVLSDLTINYGPFVSTGGIFTSQIFSVGSLISAWGPVVISDAKSSGTITYQFGSTTTASVSAISNWASITNGAVPSVSTNPFAAFRATFTSTDGNASLALSEFITYWTEGGTIPSPISINYDRRYWVSLTTSNVTAPTQDSVYVYQRNRTWTSLKGVNASSFALWRDNLFFGDSLNSGNVYQFDVGTSDNGSAITSTIVTKSYDMGMHLQDKDYRRSYLTFYGGNSGTFSLGFFNDQGSTLYSLGSANMNDGVGQVLEKYPFPLDGSVPLQGRELQYVLTKSGSGDRLKLFDISLDFTPKEAP